MSKSFEEMSESIDRSLLIVDGLNMAFRWKHAKSKDFAESYLATIDSLKKSYKCEKVIVVADGGSSKYRTNIYPEYKANRKDKYAEQTEEEYQEFLDFLQEFKRSLDIVSTKYPVLQFDGVEADDIAAYICKKIHTMPITKIWLISSDKDYDLLISEHISRFSYVTRKETTLENWYSHYDCNPDQYISIKCLTGDPGDNIKGVDGIGLKRASDLIKEYGTAMDIVASIPIVSKYKFMQALNNSADKILLNYQLMDLISFCEDALGDLNIKSIERVLDEYIRTV